MWYCSQCGAQNEDTYQFCATCGAQRPDPQQQPQQPQQQTWQQPQQQAWQQPQAWAAPPQPPKKSLWWIWLLVGVLVLGLAAAVFFFVHVWSPATCTEPEICVICHHVRGAALGHDYRDASCTEPAVCARCGEKGGEALGHDFQPATCTEPEICSRCGEKQGEALGHQSSGPATCEKAEVCARCGETLSPALGHDWAPATYDAPETCTRCGKEQGQLKGYIGELEGDWAQETLSLYGRYTTIPFFLKTPVEQCMRMTFYFGVSNIQGNAFGTWGLYGRDLDGRWQQLTTFEVGPDAVDKYVAYEFTLDGRPSFDALGVLPLAGNIHSGSYDFIVDDVQVYVD